MLSKPNAPKKDWMEQIRLQKYYYLLPCPHLTGNKFYFTEKKYRLL
jgi:hypothetical protein